jgi:tRNA (cmo5U34)-methyltransferase
MPLNSTTYGRTVWNPAEYDAPRHRLVPSFDLLYGSTAEQVAIAVGDGPAGDVLDLGAGTGLLSAAVVARVPAVRLHLLDGSADMLGAARQRLANRTDTRFTEADLTGPLPAGPFAAVVSALAIHHLSGERKRDLYGRAFAALQPGGVFVNLDQVLGPTPAVERQYAAAHEAYARRHGSDDAEWAGAQERMRADRPDTLDDQLRWLRTIGFGDVDCAAKDGRFAVLVAWRLTP